MSIAKRCKHGVEYMYDDHGEAWTDCRKCTPMNNDKQQECCEECFKWGDKYGEYKHPCHNTDCECHTPQQDTWKERLKRRFDIPTWMRQRQGIDDNDTFTAEEVQETLECFYDDFIELSDQQGYQRGVQDVLDLADERIRYTTKVMKEKDPDTELAFRWMRDELSAFTNLVRKKLSEKMKE